MTDFSRRSFMQATGILAMRPMDSAFSQIAPPKDKPIAKPEFAPQRAANGVVVVSSGNGIRATEKAASMLNSGKGVDTLDAVVAGVNIVEEDPNDMSVGYGGLPNEEGVVELDSCVMHGPTCRAGSVASLRNIKTPSSVAKLVMERTDHVMIVGEGALKFAKAHGFKECDLLTDEARKAWLEWKENHSDDDDWIPPLVEPDGKPQSSRTVKYPFTYGTITCLALNVEGSISGVTTTSGLSYKIPGRVGDSPIIGAGLYVDNKVGAAGATGRGEACIKICGSHTVVEAMRGGKSPTEACLVALQRVVDTTTEKRLRLPDGRPNFDIKFYALSRDGRFGSASMWEGGKFAVFADGKNRLEDASYLYKKPEAKG